MPNELLPILLLLLVPLSAPGEWVFQQSAATNVSLRAVHAVSANVVWTGGSGGTCWRTIDGGQNWRRLPVVISGELDFRSVFAFDANNAIVVSAGEAERELARIYHTRDAGQSWQLVFQTADKGVFLDGICFWDAENGLVLGDPIDGAWYLQKTTDAGRTWTRLRPKEMPSMLAHEAAFAASNSAMVMQGSSNVWIASGGAERARVFRSTDRGETWQVADTPLPSGPTAGIFGLRFRDANNGIAVGGDHKKESDPSDNVIVTKDGGRTWEKAAHTEPVGLKESVWMISPDVWLAAGPSGSSLSRDFGKSWMKVDLSPFHALSGVDGECWAVGAKGAIARWKP